MNWLNRKFREKSLWPGDKFLDPHLHPITAELEANYAAIRDEVVEVMRRHAEFPRFDEISPCEAHISSDGGWRMFYLRVLNWNAPRNQSAMPVTMGIVNLHRGISSVFLSCVSGNTTLNPHYGYWAGILRLHFGVLIPDGGRCLLVNGGEKYAWQNGEAVMFDDTYLHYAINASNDVRVILFLDIVRPLPWPWSWINWLMMRYTMVSSDILSRRRNFFRWQRKFYLSTHK